MQLDTIEADCQCIDRRAAKFLNDFLNHCVNGTNFYTGDTGTTLDQPGPGAFVRRLSALATARGWLDRANLRCGPC